MDFYLIFEGGWRVFVGVMKYFRDILMGYDLMMGQNFWWATKYFPMFYFCNFIFYVKGFAAQNIQTSDQGDLRKIRHVK